MKLSNSAGIKKTINEVFSENHPWSRGSMGGVVKSCAMKVLNFGVAQAIPFTSRNGFKVLESGNGYIKSFMPLKGNKNHFGAMYAGAIFTVAEVPGGIVALLNFDDRFFPVLKDLKIEFIKMAKSDVTFTFKLSQDEITRIQREAESRGKADFVFEGAIKDKDDEIVARSYATYQLKMKS